MSNKLGFKSAFRMGYISSKCVVGRDGAGGVNGFSGQQLHLDRECKFPELSMLDASAPLPMEKAM